MKERPPMLPEDDATGESSNQIALCPECQNGLLQMRWLTYFTWLNDELITVPDFPAWVCNVCGRREYDHKAIAWLNALLNPEARRGPHRSLYGPSPHNDQPQTP